MTENHKKEELSRAFAWAIAAHAGLKCTIPVVDDDSVDLTIEASGQLDAGSVFLSPKIDIQLKASSQQSYVHEMHIAFPLPVKNYNDLRVRTMVPRLLVVLILPESPSDWLATTEECLIAKKCAYFLSLNGHADTSNNDTVTVHLPRSNVLTPESLRNMMVRASREEPVL